MDVPSARPFFSEADIKAISEEISGVLRSGQLILGPRTKQFEQAFREYCGVKHAVAVSSCTAALEISLRYFDVKNSEVIMPTNTFITTGNAVIFSGGNLILADINPDTLCLDPTDLRRKITSKTKGVIVVDIGGLPCPDIKEIQDICREGKIFLIEDAAHAHGAMIDSQKTGSFGNAGCFSFYATKVMTTSTGGMITTNDDGLADYAVSLRNYGVGRYLENVNNLGNDWLMSEMSAVLGIYQLKSIESNIIRRNEIAQEYNTGLAELPTIKLFKVPNNFRHSYYKYAILLPKSINKRNLIEKMKSNFNIAVGSLYDPPCHLQPVYRKYFGFQRGMFPVAEDILERTICLPMFSQMTETEIGYVLQSLRQSLLID